MKIQHKTSLSIFVFGITFFLITTIIYTFVNREQEIEEAKQVSYLHLNKATDNLETRIGEQISIAKTLANSWVLKKELKKSNEMLGKLGGVERAELIKSLNDRWMATKDINDPFVQSYMTSTASRVLKEHSNIFPGIVGEAFVTDYYGKVVGTTNKLTTVAHSHKYWWIESFNNAKGKVFIDDRGFDDSVGGYVLGVVVPVFEDEKVIGILKVNVNIVEHIRHVVSLYGEEYSGQIMIVRSLGKIVYEKGREPLSSTVDERIVEQFTKNSKGDITFDVGRNKSLYSYSMLPMSAGSDKIGFGGTKKSLDHRGGNVGEGWYVVIVRNYDDILEGVTSTDKIIVIYGIVISIIMGFLALRFGKALSKPIEIISNAAGEIGEGNFNTRVGINRDDEIGKLASALNSMAANLSNITASRDVLNKEVSERKRAEEALAENQKNLIKAQEISHLGHWRLDPETMAVDASDELFMIFGLSREEATLDAFAEVVHPEDRDYDLSHIRRGIEHGEPWDIEHRLLMKDGTVKWVHAVGKPMLDEKGRVEVVMGTTQDITERKKAEQAINTSHIENTALLDAARSIIENRPFNEAAKSIFDTCKQLIGATAGYIALLSQSGDENEVLFLDAGGRECTVDTSLPMPIRGLRAESYKTGKTVCDNNFMDSDWMKAMPSGHVDLDNVMFAPLVIDGKTAGIMGLANKDGDFTDEDARVASAFGELAAVALKNSRVHEALTRNIKDKEVLLMEVHHRVKNNMAIIVSLLEMQSYRTDNSEALEMLNDSRNRISSMALVHEKLFSSDNLCEIQLREYIASLTSNIISSFSDSVSHIDCKLEIEQVALDMDRLIPFGLILNETITNTVKHAFKGIENPSISLAVTRNEKDFTLSVEDNGNGIAEGVDLLKSRSLGGNIINALVKQLKGNMRVDSSRDGTSIKITCPL